MDIIAEIIIKTSQESEETDWKMQISTSHINKNSISSKLGKTAPWVDQAVDRFSEADDRPVDRLPDLVDCLVDQGTQISQRTIIVRLGTFNIRFRGSNQLR